MTMGQASSISEGYIYGGGASEPYGAIRGGYVEGGGCACSGFIGGAEGDASIKDIAGYSDSAAKRAKDEIVTAVVRTVGNLFGEPLPSDPSAALAELKRRLPDPKKGEGFQASSEAQKTICEGLAKGFNQNLTPGRKGHKALIDTNGDPAYVCRAVAELVDGLSAGMRVEFLDIQAELRRLIRNIEILHRIAQENMDSVEGVVEASGDSELRRDADAGLGRGSRALAALGQQLEVLRNLLSTTVADAEKEMELALREKDENLKNVLEGLGMDSGSKALSDNIAGTMVGLATVASMAKALNEALKKVGMEVGSFFGATSFADIEKAADAASRASPDKVGEILAAKETLKKHFNHRGRKGLRKQMGGGEDEYKGGDDVPFIDGLEDSAMGAGECEDMNYLSDAVEGGAEDEDPMVRSITKKMKKERRERNLIVREFVKKLHRAYGNILKAVKEVAPQIGKSVPTGPKLDEFVDALNGLTGGRTKYLELALVGYYPDSARASSMRASYLADLDRLRSAMSGLGSAPGLEQIRSAIEEVEKTVSFYGDVMAKRAASGAGEDATTGGGVIEEKDLDKMFPALNSTAHSIKEAVRVMRYHAFLSGVQSNMKVAAEEIESYGENYAELLGDAVAERLESDGVGFEKLREILKKYTPGGADDVNLLEYNKAFALQDYLKIVKAFPGRSAAEKEKQTEFFQGMKETALNRVSRVQKAKAGMYRAAQAVDLGLQAFTREAIQRPEAIVRDVKKTLEDTKVIARWYNDNTGDTMVKAFESLRSRVDADNLVERVEKVDVFEDDGVPKGEGHYYNQIASISKDDLTLGDAFVPQIASEGDMRRAYAAAEDTFKNLQALKNVINVFVRVGVPTKMFMRASELYSTLVEYLVVSTYRVPSRVENTTHEKVTPKDEAWTETTALRQLMHFSFAPTFRGSKTAHRANGKNVSNDAAVGRLLECMHMDQTNTLFFTTLKAMCAKIMSVLNMYDMMEKPSKLGGLAPIRMILGGNETVGGGVPEIIPDAAPLYFHLPRLMEFYVDLFLRRHNPTGADEPFGNASSQFPGGRDGNTMRLITLVPDASGVFSKFINLYFEKYSRTNEGPTRGVYGVGHGSEVLSEINQIYKHFANRGDIRSVAQSACRAFAAEVNRRYGVVSKAQWEAMDKLWRSAYMMDESHLNAPGSDDTTNYAILPGEDDDAGITSMGAPSDSYILDPSGRGRGAKDLLKPRKHKFHLGKGDWDMLRDLRDAVSKYFETDDGSLGITVYEDIIEARRDELARARDAEKKFGIAMELLGVQSGIKTGGAAWMEDLVFCEVIAFPLKMLNRMSKLVMAFVDYVDGGLFNSANLLSTLMLLNSLKGLVSVNVGRSKDTAIMLDFTGLTDLMSSLAAGIRSELPKWKPKIDPKLYKNIVGEVGSGATTYPDYSLGWIENYVIDTILKSRPSIRKSGDPRSMDPKSLSKIQEKLIEGFNRLTMDQAVFADLAHATEEYTTRGDGNGLGPIAQLMRKDQEMKDGRLVSGSEEPHAGGLVWGNSPTHRSVFTGFNRIVAQLIRSGYDQASSKIYGGLIRDLAMSGPLAASVTLTSKDMRRTSTLVRDFVGARSQPIPVKTDNTNAEHILVSSNALILKRLATDRSRDGTSIHIAESLAEVPEIVKGRMRATFPELIRRCDQVSAAARFLDQVISRQVDATIHFFPMNLGKIMEGCASVKKALSRTLSELGDRPAGLMEVRSGFFESYSARYGKPALVLASMAFGTRTLEDFVNPTRTATLTEFMHGIRSLYSDASALNASNLTISSYKGYGKPSNYGKLVADLQKVFDLQDSVDSAGALYLQGRPNLGSAKTTLSADSTVPVDASTKSYTEVIEVLESESQRGAGAKLGCNSVVQARSNALKSTSASSWDGKTGSWYMQLTKIGALMDQALEGYDGAVTIKTVAPETLFEKYFAFLMPDQNQSKDETRRKVQEDALKDEVNVDVFDMVTQGIETPNIDDINRRLASIRDLSALDGGNWQDLLKGDDTLIKLEYSDNAKRAFSAMFVGELASDRLVNLGDYVGIKPSTLAYKLEDMLGRADEGVRSTMNAASQRAWELFLNGLGKDFGRDILARNEGIEQFIENQALLSDKETFKPFKALRDAVQKQHVDPGFNRYPGNMIDLKKPSDRQKEVRASIIELNIAPINVHALLRGIPFASLYNYEYTFEEMAASALGTSREGVRAHLLGTGKGTGVPQSRNLTTRDAFLSLLFNPQQIAGYTSGDVALNPSKPPLDGVDRSSTAALEERADRFFGKHGTRENGLLLRMARGQDNLRMGRPKFISDELFNKCLLTNVWPRHGVYVAEDDPRVAPDAAGAAGPPDSAASSGLMTWQDVEASGSHRGRAGPTVQSREIDPEVREALFKIGRERFDTMFVRSAYITASVQRMMGYHLRTALTEDRRVIRPTHSLVAPSMTEFATGETLDEARDFE